MRLKRAYPGANKEKGLRYDLRVIPSDPRPGSFFWFMQTMAHSTPHGNHRMRSEGIGSPFVHIRKWASILRLWGFKGLRSDLTSWSL